MRRMLASAAVAGGLAASPLSAADLTIELTLPEVAVAAYYRPYLAAWIETEDGVGPSATLAVWYDTRLRHDLGKRWLRHLRTWWRNAGETMQIPAHGFSGPTRGPGTYRIVFSGAEGPLSGLEPGRYQLVVEVRREHGGHDLVRLPLDWTGGAASAVGAGTEELGTVRLIVVP